MTLPARHRTGGPTELDEPFGRTHRFPGVLCEPHTPFRSMAVAGIGIGIGTGIGIGIDPARERARVPSGCREQGRARQAMRRAGVSATIRPPR